MNIVSYSCVSSFKQIVCVLLLFCSLYFVAPVSGYCLVTAETGNDYSNWEILSRESVDLCKFCEAGFCIVQQGNIIRVLNSRTCSFNTAKCMTEKVENLIGKPLDSFHTKESIREKVTEEDLEAILESCKESAILAEYLPLLAKVSVTCTVLLIPLSYLFGKWIAKYVPSCESNTEQENKSDKSNKEDAEQKKSEEELEETITDEQQETITDEQQETITDEQQETITDEQQEITKERK